MKTFIASALFDLIEANGLFKGKADSNKQAIKNIMNQSDRTLGMYYQYIQKKNKNTELIASSLFGNYNKNNEDKIADAMECILESSTYEGERAIISFIDSYNDSEILNELMESMSNCLNINAPQAIYDLYKNTNYSNDTVEKIADILTNIKPEGTYSDIINEIFYDEIIYNDECYENHEEYAIEDSKIIASAKGYEQADNARLILDDYFNRDKSERLLANKLAGYAAKAETAVGANLIYKYYTDIANADIRYANIFSRITDEAVANMIYNFLTDGENYKLKVAYGDRYPDMLSIAASSKCPKTVLSVIKYLYDRQAAKSHETFNVKILGKDEINVVEEVLKYFKKLDKDSEAPYANYLLRNDVAAFQIAMDNPSYIKLIYSLHEANKLDNNAFSVIPNLEKIRRKDNTMPIKNILFEALVNHTSNEGKELFNDSISYSNSIAKSSSKYVDFDECYVEDPEFALKGLKEITDKYPNIDINPKTCYVRKRKS